MNLIVKVLNSGIKGSFDNKTLKKSTRQILAD